MTPDFASQLCAAICEAFTIDELSRLLRLRMGVDFDDIRPHPSTREEAVFALVEWARRENRVPELLRAVAGE
ncbi:MAG TPA: effector-associated domain EAD1-containing protein, partial [Gemmataceae bacterium]|nr:effector-associated domain EAD1-containing protein [Gemmataceae bacterium]